jgi:hypothetical protein
MYKHLRCSNDKRSAAILFECPAIREGSYGMWLAPSSERISHYTRIVYFRSVLKMAVDNLY